MIDVKFFGLLRLDYKVDSLHLSADGISNVVDLLTKISAEIHVPIAELKEKNIFVNGTDINNLSGKRTKIVDGCDVMLLSPVAGG